MLKESQTHVFGNLRHAQTEHTYSQRNPLFTLHVLLNSSTDLSEGKNYQTDKQGNTWTQQTHLLQTRT